MLRLALPGAGLALFALACGCVQTRESPPPSGPIVDASTAPPPDDGPALGALACGAADGAVTLAPADTDAAVAPSGPYLWRNAAIVAGGFVTGIVFSRAQPDVVYARTDIGGAYRWNAATARWMPLLDWIGRTETNLAGVESIAADPHDALKVYLAAGMYVASGNGAILVSNDEGQTFQTVATSIPMGSNNDGRSVGERLAIDPNNGQILYFGSRTSGLWKSADGAMTWSQVVGLPGLAASDGGAAVGPATTPNGVGIPFVQFDPTSCGPGGQTVVYAAVAVTGTSLYRSDDGGATWSAVAGQPAMGLLPNRAALSSTGALYVTYGGGTGTNGDGPNNVTAGAVWRLDTASGSWTNVTPVTATNFGFAGVSVDAEQPQTVVVSTIDRWSIGDDIYRSTDSGQHWTAVGVPAAAHDVSAAPWVTFHQAKPDYTGWLGDVEIDPFRSNRLLHTTGQGIWGSDDITAVDSNQPTHWDFRSLGIEQTAVNDLTSPTSGPSLISAVGDIGGFRHDDLTVSPAGGMSDNPVFSSTDSVDFAGGTPAIVARVGRGGTQANPDGGSPVASAGAYSIDGGTTWQPFPTSLPISTSSAGMIAVSADGSTFVWDAPASTTPVSAAGPRYSLDHGATWTLSAGIGAVRVVVADKVTPLTFYAFDGTAGASSTTGGRVLVSTDGAMTFTPGFTGLPTRNARLRANPGIAGDLWLTAAGNVYHSTDAGTTFAQVTSVSAAFALGVGMGPAGLATPSLYVGGTVNALTGIFRSDDLGATWTQIDDPAHRFATATVIAGDPRTYGRVYVGNNGRGIFYGDIVSP